MNKTEIRKIVEKDLLEFFDAKTLLSNNQILMELCIDSTLKAINYKRCCTPLKTENKPLSYDEWKEKLNVKKVEETIYKKGDHYITINNILEMYNEYCSSF